MAILKFRQISLADWQTLEVKDPDTRYIVYNEDESIYGEFIGEEKVTKEVETEIERLDDEKASKDEVAELVKVDEETITRTEDNKLQVSEEVINDINKITGLQTTLETLETSKQDKLVAGDNITIVGNTISASGGNGGGSSDPDALLASNQEAKTPAFTEPVAVDADGKLWSKAGSGGGGGEVDLNEMAYFDYAGSIYGAKYSLLVNAWDDMKEVDVSEIERESTMETQYGTLQYPNGEDNGVIIPDSVTIIGDNAFAGWEANNQPLVIPNNLTSIGEGAFRNWEANNQPLVIPNSVTSIGSSAFRNWEANNQPLVIPNSVTSIGSRAFRNWEANNQPLVIPNSVTSIGDGAFADWTSNDQQLVIPNSVTSISETAFADWTSNDQPLVIPDSVTNIGGYAFSGWFTNNQPLVIPNSVTSIGEGAFYYWPNVPYVEMKRETPPTLSSSNAFNDQNNAPIYVPDESVDDYKNATNWVNLANRIFPVSEKTGSLDDALLASNQEAKTSAFTEPVAVDADGKLWSKAGSGGGGGEVDLNEMAYFDYASNIYGAKYSLLANAWQDMKEVDGAEIERDSTDTTQYGTLQYPNGEDNGVIIPNGVTSIGEYAFAGWIANNQPLVIPNSVTSLGYGAFAGWEANNQPLVIPNSITSIGEVVFGYWAANNQPLIIPNSVTSIGEGAFSDWPSNNQPLVIPDSVTSIDIYAFSGWSVNNQPLIIPNSVTSIGNNAFESWTSNNQPLVIPNSVTSIGDMAFNGWSANNQPLVIPNSVTSIGESAFQNWTANNQPLVIPNSVTSIGGTAFSYWSANTHPLVIPDSVDSIGNNAFESWTSNNQPLVIPNSVTSIDWYAFQDWTSNNQPLVIGNSVTSIGGSAFRNWTNVPYVEMKSETPPILEDSNAFDDQNNAPIYVPDGSVTAYKNATNWSAHASRIFPVSEKTGSAGSGEGGGIDLDEIGYLNYSAKIFYDSRKQNQFKNAWEDMKEVDPAEIERNSTYQGPIYGKLQYPNGEDNGVIIPDSVTSIGNWAFGGWTSNNQPLVIPNSVTSIGGSAFDSWEANNQPLVIPNSVTSIGSYAFRNWAANNQPLVIPNSVTSIGTQTFKTWSNVPYVEMKSETPPELDNSNAFDSQNNAPIYVPNASVTAYKNATNWSAHASRIFSINEK